jgi:hypothetical protein
MLVAAAGPFLKFNGLIHFRKDIADLHRQLACATPMLLRSTLATQSAIVLAVEREQIYSESRRRLSSMS